MNGSEELIGNKQKAIIHIAKQELKLNDMNYRSLLQSVGVNSSKELTWWRYHQLLGHFKVLGFEIKSKKGPRWKRSPPKDKERLLGKIAAILSDLGLPDAYADGVAKRVAKVDKVVFADTEGLRKIVAALVYHQKRKKTAVGR